MQEVLKQQTTGETTGEQRGNQASRVFWPPTVTNLQHVLFKIIKSYLEAIMVECTGKFK